MADSIDSADITLQVTKDVDGFKDALDALRGANAGRGAPPKPRIEQAVYTLRCPGTIGKPGGASIGGGGDGPAVCRIVQVQCLLTGIMGLGVGDGCPGGSVWKADFGSAVNHSACFNFCVGSTSTLTTSIPFTDGNQGICQCLPSAGDPPCDIEGYVQPALYPAEDGITADLTVDWSFVSGCACVSGPFSLPDGNHYEQAGIIVGTPFSDTFSFHDTNYDIYFEYNVSWGEEGSVCP